MTRTARTLAGAGLAALLLAGCGTSQPGAAAVVGGTSIAADRLQRVVDRGLADPQAEQKNPDRVAFQTSVLDRLVHGALLQDLADRLGVPVTQGDVDAFLGQAAERNGGRAQLDKAAAAAGVGPADLSDYGRVAVLEQKVGDALVKDVPVPQAQLEQAYQQNIAQFVSADARHILVPDEAQARQILAQVQADPSRFGELAKQFSTDTSTKAAGGELGQQGKGTYVPAFDDVVFSAPVGSFNVVKTQFGWHVVQVESRRTTTLEEATPELRRSLLGEQISSRLSTELGATAKRESVDVNPRFGRWDAKQLKVVGVPADDGLSSPAPGASGPAADATSPAPAS